MKNLLVTVCIVFFAVSIIQAQETVEIKGKKQKQEKLLVKIKDDANPDIYVDGKKFDFPLELLDADKIESISVIKDEQAIKEYSAPNGVVLITTKKEMEFDNSKIKIRATGSMDGEKAPMIIIDGEVAGKEALEKLSPDDVESISVVKDEQAMEKYNAPNGVVIVTTKKGEKGKSK
jgi:hypothetical protein